MTVQEYLRKIDREKLVDILRAYCEGNDNLHPDIALMICGALAESDPDKPDVYEAFRNLCSIYLP